MNYSRLFKMNLLRGTHRFARCQTRDELTFRRCGQLSVVVGEACSFRHECLHCTLDVRCRQRLISKWSNRFAPLRCMPSLKLEPCGSHFGELCCLIQGFTVSFWYGHVNRRLESSVEDAGIALVRFVRLVGIVRQLAQHIQWATDNALPQRVVVAVDHDWPFSMQNNVCRSRCHQCEDAAPCQQDCERG